jgi:hypothetical protein
MHLTKKLLPVFLTLILLSIAVPMQVFAANPITLTVTPSKTTANVGEEITIDIVMGSAAGTNLASLQFDIVLPAGLVFVSGERNNVSAATIGFAEMTFDERPSNRFRVLGYGVPSPGYNETESLIIATITCTVASSGTHPVSLDGVVLGNFAGTAITATPVSASIVVSNFGDNPSTNVLNIAGYISALFAFLILSVVLWSLVLRRKLRGVND